MVLLPVADVKREGRNGIADPRPAPSGLAIPASRWLTPQNTKHLGDFHRQM